MRPPPSDLPIEATLPALGRALAEHTAAVLQAPPGAGKTTRVPLALLDQAYAPWLAGRRVLVLEPRRLAARAAATFMARLLGEDAGGTVGYRTRMDTRISARTRVEVLTEGVLTRMLQSDPTLDGVGAVLFDEFHERSLHADLGLALALDSQSVLRDDLRILVMSATLDGEAVAALLGGGEPAPIVSTQGRSWPVETRYLRHAPQGHVEAATARAILDALRPQSSAADTDRARSGAGRAGKTAAAHDTAGGGPPGSGDAPEAHAGGLRDNANPAAARETPVRGLPGSANPAAVRDLAGGAHHLAGGADASDGRDILAFLPGAAEIHRVEARLAEAELPAGTRVYPLYGNLPREVQDRAIAPSSPGERKVVLATSIAETSLTIEGIGTVVDSGLMRVPRFDPRTGMTRLETATVTRASADQRRGRAGRTGPGICYRLWTLAQEATLLPRGKPEILEADLAPLALELAAWGVTDPTTLRWLDPPPAAAFAQARELLIELGALEATAGAARVSGSAGAPGPVGGTAGPAEPAGHAGLAEPAGTTAAADTAATAAARITAHGRRMAATGLHPRLAHMVVQSLGQGHGALGTELAALLSERDIFRAGGPGAGERLPTDADVRLRVEALRAATRGSAPRVYRGLTVDRGAAQRAAAEARRWRRSLGIAGAEAAERPGDIDAAGLLLAFAYPDRIAQRRPGQRGRFLLRNGRGAVLDERQPLAAADWIVAAELEGGQGGDARIFLAAPVEPAELERHFAPAIVEETTVAWDDGADAVRARRRRRLGALVLREAPVALDPAEVAAAVLGEIRRRGVARLPWGKEATRLRQRIAFLHRLDPAGWPDVSDPALAARLDDWLAPWLQSARSWTDVERLDLRAAIESLLPWERRRTLDELAPTHLQVSSGSRVPIDYADADAPVLAVRIQELFGLAETPRIANGRTALTLHLLSPARRPVQITRDLASFWRDAYFQVRKDLRGRYPRHDWPDDPTDRR